MTANDRLKDAAYYSDARVLAASERWWGEIRGMQVAIEDLDEEGWPNCPPCEAPGCGRNPGLEGPPVGQDCHVQVDPVRWIEVKFEVCGLCSGRGHVVNPSIDAHGLTREDFDEDPDFRESYLSGDYDIPCTLCGGERVVPVPVDDDDAEYVASRVRERQEAMAEDYAEARYFALMG